MKVHSYIRFELIACAALLGGCATHPKEQPIQQRGWIGGSYERAAIRKTSDWFFRADDTMFTFPPTLAPAQKAGILVTALATNAPAFRAGLREGDLILKVDSQPVADLPDFLRIVTETQPGGSLSIDAFRKGKTIDCNVTSGREKYREGGNITVAFPGFYEWPRLIPTQNWNSHEFSLVALGYKRDDHSPFEFDSVKERYRHDCHPKDKQQGYDEEWKMWLAIVQVSKGKTILEQDSVPAPAKD